MAKRLTDNLRRALLAQAASADRTTPDPSISGTAGWFQVGGPRHFLRKHWTLTVDHLAPTLAGLRIVHLSDLHAGRRWVPAYDRLIDYLRAAPPDLLLYTGDFVEDPDDHRRALPILRRLFASLCSRLGIYAILGNHDSDLLVPFLADTGVNFISGRRVLLADAHGAVELIGLPGPARSDYNGHGCLAPAPRPPGTTRIVLCHYPDLFLAARDMEPDLYLAGHSHGGQICLPGGYPIARHNSMPRRFCRDVHRLGRTWYVINHGFGYTGVPLRVFCPSEIVELTLAPNAAPRPGDRCGESVEALPA